MKQVEINVGRWKGHVMLHDPIPMVKLAVFEGSVERAFKIDKNLGKAESHVEIIPALVACVAEWHIEGFPESVTIETFPGAGSGMAKKDIANLINQIINRILKLYQGQDPNE